MIIIRNEKPSDYKDVYSVNKLAFEQEGEADLVKRLRKIKPHISLVAEKNNEIIGHIFFSPVTIEPTDENFNAVGLAPMAVLPEFQNQSVGSALVKCGLEECKNQNFDACFVLGHPEYYPRFGFQTAKENGFDCEYEVPNEVFMVLELKPNSLKDRTGTVKYDVEFAKV